MILSAGWLAGYGSMKGILNNDDHIVIDFLAHNCLYEGARAATKNIHRVKHLSN
jgi:glycine C-acetyltransferase